MCNDVNGILSAESFGCFRTICVGSNGDDEGGKIASCCCINCFTRLVFLCRIHNFCTRVMFTSEIIETIIVCDMF